jgi:hypothetical protein
VSPKGITRPGFEEAPIFLADTRLGRGDFTRRPTEALAGEPEPIDTPTRHLRRQRERRQAVIAAVEVLLAIGPTPSRQIKATVCDALNVSERLVKLAAQELIVSGRLVVTSDPRDRRFTCWELSKEIRASDVSYVEANFPAHLLPLKLVALALNAADAAEFGERQQATGTLADEQADRLHADLLTAMGADNVYDEEENGNQDTDA